MQKIRLNDQEQRDAILEQLDCNFFVEAGAGSGKTTAMIGRMIALLESKDWEPSMIAAITFTNQAATHMKQKFQETLEQRIQVLQSKGPSIGLSRLQKAYAQMNILFVGTIHSFCQNLLKEMPLEAGLDSSFSLMDEREETEDRQNFWDQYKYDRLDRDPDLFERWHALGITLELLDHVFAFMCRYEDVAFDVSKVEVPDVDTAFVKLCEWMEPFQVYLPSPQERCDVMSQMWHTLEQDLNHYGGVLPLDRKVHYLIQMSAWGNLKVTQKLWSDPKLAKIFVHEKWPAMREAWLDSWVQIWMAHIYYQVMPWMLEGVKAYQDHRQSQHRLSMMDLLLRSVQMLQKNPAVRRYWKDRFRTLLVDEFQDTDPLQSELIFYLSGDDVEQTDWQKLKPEPGRLFVVGDSKQSIYRFRRADMRLYYQIKQLFQETGGYICYLTSNFRSTQILGDWVNKVFDRSSAFPAEKTDYQAQFMPLRCVKDGDESSSCIWALRSTAKNVVQKAWDEADQIARWIAHQGASYRDYMIISYNTARLPIYQHVCQSYGIPTFLAVKERKDVSLLLRDIHRLLLWMAQPENEFLAYGVLRSLLFGLSDTELAEYRLQGKGSFELKPIQGDSLVTQVFRMVCDWKKSLKRMSAIQLVMCVYEDLSLFGLAQQLSQGDFEANQLALFLDYLSMQNPGSVQTLSGLLEVFDCFQSTQQKSLHGFVQDAHQVVRIMNLHQSKGLEAKTVFLVDPASLRRRNPEFHLDRTKPLVQAYASLLAFSKNASAKKVFAQALDWNRCHTEETLADEAERQRLLYVAATRAKERLVVSDSAKSVWGDFSEFLDGCATLPYREFDLKTHLERAQEKAAKISLEDYLAQMRQPSFRSESVTSTKGVRPNTGEEGLGANFGTMLHRVFEELVRRRYDADWDVETWLRSTVEQEHCDRVLEQVLAFQQSSLWQRIATSFHVYVEVPFSQAKEGGEQCLQTGVIDLVFHEEDGWVIVDYKSNMVQKNFEALVDYYKPQMKGYAQAWAHITGEKVKESLLYFSSHHKIISLD